MVDKEFCEDFVYINDDLVNSKRQHGISRNYKNIERRSGSFLVVFSRDAGTHWFYLKSKRNIGKKSQSIIYNII